VTTTQAETFEALIEAWAAVIELELCAAEELPRTDERPEPCDRPGREVTDPRARTSLYAERALEARPHEQQSTRNV
jgi:hypothetical protein